MTALVLLAAALLLVSTDLQRALLRSLLAPQRHVLQQLLPDMQPVDLRLDAQGEGLKLSARSVTSRYVVVRGQAHAPGIQFEAITPARAALLHGLLVIAAAIAGFWLRPANGASDPLPGLRGAAGLLAAWAAMVVIPAVTLAGAQWGVALAPFQDLSAPAVLVGASDFLLHGGAYALCGALGLAPWWLGRVQRSSAARHVGQPTAAD